jgi:hypothetical protein
LLPFEFDGRQHSVPDMPSFGIAEHLDVVEHVLSCLGVGFVVLAPYPFALEQAEEAFSDGVVRAVPPLANLDLYSGQFGQS